MNQPLSPPFSIWRRWWMAYVLAMVMTSVTIWLRLLFGYHAGDPPLLLVLLIPIMLSAYTGGLGPGLLATGVAALESAYYLLPPLHSLTIGRASTSGLIALVVDGVLISVFVKLLTSSHDRLKLAQDRAVWLASFPERNPNPIVEVDVMKNVIHYANPAAARLFPELEDLKLEHPLVADLQAIAKTLVAESKEVIRREVMVGQLAFSQTITYIPENGRLRIYSNDITERKQTESALRDSEARFRALFEQAPIGIAQGDIATMSFISVNQRFCEIVGYPQAELKLMNFKQFTHPDDLQADLDNMAQLIAGKVHHYRMEKRYIQKNGNVVWASLTIVPLWSPEEKPTSYMAVVEDVTERKQAVEALRESQALYHSLVEQMPAGIFRKDASGHYVFVSRSFCELKAMKPEQFIGKTALELGLEDAALASSGASHHVQIMQTGRQIEVEEKYVHPDGREFYFHVVKSPVFDAAGQIVGSQGVLFDATARKLAEMEARESEARYRTLFNTLIEGFCTIEMVFDAAGKPVDYRFLEVNPAFEKQTGLHGAEGKLMRDLAPNHETHWFEIYGKIALTGEPLHFENEAKALGRYYDVHAYRIEDPKKRKVAILFNDITQRKLAEAEIRKLNVGLERRVTERTAQLEAANKELEAFSYSVSHDLRAPLRAVNGFAGIVLEDFGPLLPEDGKRYLTRIRNGGQQMGQLIDDLLAFSSLSRQSMSRHTVENSKLVKSVIDELKPHWEKDRQIDIRLGELPVGYGDSALLKQAWINLISNAVKYTRGRKPAVVEIGCLCQSNPVTYFVRDNGTGFDMQYAHKLFGVFQRLHRADEFEGTGVGLAIVQRVIHRHGGRVWAEAKPDQGATFYFTLEEENKL